MEINLSKQTWFLKGYWPWVPLKDKSMETGEQLVGTTDWIPATVRGGVHYDLYRAGLIDHPYYEMNSLTCEWIENRWWVYKTTFMKPEELGEKYELIFKGVDYEAIFYLNGQCLGEHKGMFHPAKFDVTSQITEDETFELVVVFKHPPDEMGQIGKTSATFTQKSRFNYKWDFSTRLVNIGFWDEIILKVHQQASIAEAALYTDVQDGAGVIDLTIHIDHNETAPNKPLLLETTCYRPNGECVYHNEIAVQPEEVEKHNVFQIEKPELWYPNGYGGQPLYRISLVLKDGERILDHKQYKTGIRKLEYMQNDDSPEEALPYTVAINGKKIYLKGFNMTPLDHLYGNVTREHYQYLLKKIVRANGNMVRVWGGGIIEKEIFYELCDQYGILVWQEFIQSSSGIDNIPSKKPEFLKLLTETATAALKEKRNHVSLTIWSGGNELMDEDFKPSTYEDENLAQLKKLVERYDPNRLFLPTSASGPVEFVTEKKGVSHDVHGNWRYGGNPYHYQLYAASDSLFHSEFGMDGVSQFKSLRKFLGERHLKPTKMSDHMVWRHHGEWWGTLIRDQEMFGPIEDISTFVDCSQWIQAEGLRYIIEANRRREFQNSGSLIWQLNEPWPNASCTNLVDYYGEEKMAYHWARKAFAPLHVSLDYRKLDYKVGSLFQAPVFVHGNGEEVETVVRVQVLTVNGSILLESTNKVQVKRYKASSIDFEFPVTKKYGPMFFVRLQLLDDDHVFHENLYTFSTKAEAVYSPALELAQVRLKVVEKTPWVQTDEGLISTCLVENDGENVCLHVYPEETTNSFWMESDDSYLTLFPGESKRFTILCLPKKAGGFLVDDQPQGEEPVIEFRTFARTY